MRKSIKKLISAVLLNIMLLSIIIPCMTVSVEAANGTPGYWLANGLPGSTLDPIITRDMLNNTQYINKFLKTNWDSNLVASTYLTGWYNLKGNWGSGERLLYNYEFWHHKNEKSDWHANFKWTPSAYTKQLAVNQELKLYLEANLLADDHNHAINHPGDKRNDRAEIQVSSSVRYMGNIINKSSDADEVFYNHNNEFTLHDCEYVNFRLGSTTCGCGSSKVKNIIIAAVDEKSPTIKEAKIYNKDGEPINYLSAGEKGIVSIIFSEPMRFADNVAKPLIIDLDLYDTAENKSMNETLKANLISLSNNTLNFEFTVPYKVDNKPTNVYIKSVSASQPDIYKTGEDRFDLVSLVKYDKGNTIHENKLDGAGMENVNRARSVITDLAGNSVAWTKAISVSNTYLDGIDPKVDGIDLILSNNRAPTYAGINSEIEATLFFSEVMKFTNSSVSDAKITLNLKDNNENPIVLSGKKAYKVKNSINRPAATAIDFSELKISKNMTLDGEKVEVVEISLPDGLTDLADNPVDINVSIPIPNQEIRLDITPPVISDAEIVGTPTYKGFTYKFTIKDNDGGSKVNGKQGTFAWINEGKDSTPRFNTDGKTFYYAITSELEPPDYPNDFTEGTISDKRSQSKHYRSFPQMENGVHYLHIRLDDDSDALILRSYINIAASDMAGNQSSYQKEIEGFKSDGTPPTVELGDHYFTTVGNTININIPVNVSDKFGVQRIYYDWDNENDFKDLYIPGEFETSRTLSKKLETVTGAVYGGATLTVYAEDIAGNKSGEKSRYYEGDISRPISNLGEIPRDPEDMSFIGPSLFIDRPERTAEYKATTAIMVRNPFKDMDSKDYFVYFLTSDDKSLKVNEEYIDFFEKYKAKKDWDEDDFAGWYSANFNGVTTLSEIGSLSINEFNTGKDVPSTPTEQFAAMFGGLRPDTSRWHHYGDLNIEVITVAEKIGMAEIKNNGFEYSTFNFEFDEADKSFLEIAIGQALKLEEEDYSDGWDDFIEILDRAQYIFEDDESSQEEIDEILQALEKAMRDLVKPQDEDDAEQVDLSAYDHRQNRALLMGYRGSDIIYLNSFPSKTSLKMRSGDPLGIPDFYKPVLDGLEEHYILPSDSYPEGQHKVSWFRPDIDGRLLDDYNKNRDLPVTVSLEEANGLKIPFKIDKPSPFLDDIDELNSYLELYYTEHRAEAGKETKLYPERFVPHEKKHGNRTEITPINVTKDDMLIEAPIFAKEGTQYFSLSINEDNVDMFKTGYYALVATVTSKSTDVDGMPFIRQDILVSDLFIDTYTPEKDDFQLTLQGNYATGGSPDITIYTDPVTDQLVGPVGCDMDWKIDIYQKGTESQLSRNNEKYYSDSYSSYTQSSSSSTKYDSDIDMNDMYWIKVWNPDVDGSEEKARWQHYTQDYMLTFINKTKKDGDEGYEYSDYYAYKAGVAYTPVINGEKNTLLYQFCSYSGVPGSTGQFTLLAAGKDIRPSFELWNSHDGDAIVKSTIVGPTEINADNLIKGYALLIEDGESLRPAIPGGPDGAEAWSVWENEKETMNFEIVKDGKYQYCIYDEYGMVGSRDIEINYIDSEKPEVTFSDEKFENGALKFTATVTDDYSLDEGYLLIKFGGDFIEGSHLKDLDKVYGDDSEYTDVYISIPLNRESISKEAYRKAGIYNLTIEDADDGKEKIVKIEMVIGNVTEYSHSDVYLDAVDSVGNDIYVSRPFYYPQEKYCVYHFDEEYKYAPAIIDAEWNSGESIVYLNFNTPVKLLSNGLSNSDYGSSVPTTISANGTYTIEYTDTFGDTYREFIEIDLPALELGLDIQYNTAPTNQNITLTVKALGDGVNITAVKIGDNAEENLSPAEQEYVMTIEENCIVYVTIKKSGVDPRTQAISIDNIDKTEITAELIWRYEGNVDEDSKTTTAPVSVTVVGNKPLLEDLTYTFTNGAKIGDKHTFEYSDEAGNTGNITATLGYNIVFPTNYEDKLAPGVDIKVYFKTFETYNQGLSGSAGNFNLSNINDEPPEGLGIIPPDYSKDTGSPIDWNGEDDVSIRSQAVRMDLKITDQSETKVFIKSSNNPPKYNGISDTIAKVKAEGNSVLIETDGNEDITPQDFYIFVVDEKNNWTSFLVKPGLLDKTAPEIEGISVKLHDSFRAEAILKIAQKDAEYTTVTNRTGIVKYDDSTYGYMTGSNETVTFYYHDSVGNSDEKSIKAEGLDTYAPELIGLTWSPQGTGTGDIQNPPTELMRGSLLAQLTIKNQFSSVKLINNEDKDVKLSFTDKKINLIFNENAEVTLEITSPNGNKLEHALSVACLDNKKLEITKSEPIVAKNKRSARLTFTPNKNNVYFVEGKQYKNMDESFDEYTVTSTKPIELNFTDKVGNVYKEKIDLSGILDFSPLKLSFNIEAKDEGAVDKLSQLDDKLNFTGDTLEAYVKSSHKVDVEGAVEKKIDSVNTWTKLTANRVGDRATLKFTDDRGDTFSTAAYYKAPDNVPPVILLKETVISISKDIATDETLKDLIKNSLEVTDNVSKVDDNTLTIEIDTSKVKFKELGLYTATITAKDESENTSTKDIQIRIAPAEGLLVQIGNRFLEPNGSHILYGKNLSFKLLKQSREDVEEPYKIYVKEELQTPGQMKSAKIYFYNDDEKDKQEIVFTSAGMHTVYIQTQNRYAYTFYVYVMD